MSAVTVWWARRRDARPELAALLDGIEHERWTGYRQQADRDRFLVGCALAKSVVAAANGLAPAGVTLDRTCRRCAKPHGKPTVKGGPELSVSHSGDRIVVAAAMSTPVGVDVEDAAGRQRDAADLAALERYVLSEAERAAIAPQANRHGNFFVVWTRKEAVLKATGDGLSVPLRDLVVSAPAAPPEVLAWPYEQDPGTVTLRDLDAGPGYAAALAVIGRCDEIVSHDGTELLTAVLSR